MARLIVHGARGSWPVDDARCVGYAAHTTCFSLTTNDGVLIVDAGTGILSLGAELERCRTLPPITLLLTHLHFDHIQGLVGFAPLMRPNARIKILADSRTLPSWQNALRDLFSPPYWPYPILGESVELVDLAEADLDTVRAAGVPIHWCAVQHPQGCVSYRLERPEGAIVIATDRECGDPGLDARFLEFCRGAEVLIHDAQFTPDEYAVRRGWGHSTWEQAARTAAQAKVRWLVLTSHDPARQDAQVDELIASAKAIFPNTLGASPTLELGT